MSPIHPKKSGGSDEFELVPEGWQSAVCVDVFDMGDVYSEFYGKTQHKVLLSWWTGRWKSDDSTVPLIVSRRYTLTTHENGALRKDVESWRGKRYRTEDEFAALDLEKLIGQPCRVLVEHHKSGDNTYANVKGIAPVGQGETLLGVPEGFVRKKDREDHGKPAPAPARPQYNGEGRPVAAGFPEADERSMPDDDFDDDLPF